MPASLATVKRKIQSTKSTRQITSAMQMVSTAKLNQIQHHTKAYEAYAATVREVLSSMVKSHSTTDADSKDQFTSLFDKRPVQQTGILVITSDRGLVGSYNSNVIKETLETMKKHHLNKDNTVFLTIGRTGTEFFKKRGMNVVYEYAGVSDVPTYKEVRGIVKTTVQMYNDGVFDELFLSYNHYVNRITSHVRVQKMMPVSEDSMTDDQPAVSEESADKTRISPEFEFEPSANDIVSVIVSQYAESLVYGAILDAKTSEHSSSANAMSSASDNADEIISDLELQYNRARQAAITTEITEITGGMTAQE